MIRGTVPKGESVDCWEAEEIARIGLRMNARRNRNLGSMTPEEVFSAVYGEEAYRAIVRAVDEWGRKLR